MENLKTEKSNNFFILALLFCCVAVIATSFYFFYFKKDYDFIVEAPCDVAKEVCFQRDCANLDDCPSNGLSDFKRYSLKASDFSKCENEDCTNACEAGTIKCEPVECAADETAGEFCSTLEPANASTNEEPATVE